MNRAKINSPLCSILNERGDKETFRSNKFLVYLALFSIEQDYSFGIAFVGPVVIRVFSRN